MTTITRLNQKLRKQITEPDGCLRRNHLGGWDREVYDFVDTARKHRDRFGYDYSRFGRRLTIYGIDTDTSRGRDWRGVLFSWPTFGSEKETRAYYLAAGGGGYDFLASATRGIKVYDNDDNLVEIGNHADPQDRPTLQSFAAMQGWYSVSW